MRLYMKQKINYNNYNKKAMENLKIIKKEKL